jgi:hypothetical protein
MATLIGPSFSLGFDTIVIVRVYAINSIGSSIVSDLNSAGAKIRVVPKVVQNPTEGDATSETQI